MKTFEMTDEQEKQYKNWRHNCGIDVGAIGGRLSFIFVPTGLGTCLTVKCVCGEKLELTDTSNW